MKKSILITIVLSVFTAYISFAQIPDETFSSDGVAGPLPAAFGSFTGEQQSIALQADGKMIIAGYYKFEDESTSFAAMRLNADGSIDNTFGSLGIKIINFDNDSYASLVLIQPDGKIILAGSKGGPGQHDMVITRLESNSAPDLTFGVQTFHFGGEHSYYNYFSSLALQSDGKILAGGHGGNNLDDDGLVLMRFNTDGTLDAGFSGDGIVYELDFNGYSAESCAVQADGKILTVAAKNHALSVNGVLRYNSDGTIDESFGALGFTEIIVMSDNRGNSLALQPDGKIVVVGNGYVWTGFNPGPAKWTISRLNTDGTFDNSFGTGGIKSIDFGTVERPDAVEATGVLILPSGRILVGGYMFDNVNTHSKVYRLTSTGAIDQNFGDQGSYALSYMGIGGMVLQTDGKFVFSTVGSGSSAHLNRLILKRRPLVTCPSNITVDHEPNKCTASVSFSATGTGDPEPTVVYKIGNNVITSPYNFSVGVTTVNVTASNEIGPDATCSFTVTVRDVDPPSITNESPSVYILSPANHTMQN
ncbi:MAG: HYR domain-containing protein, partial [Bacteroidota bacterium]